MSLQNHSYKLVGFTHRTYKEDAGGAYLYDNTNNTHYSMVLTNAAFLHKEYLRKFADTLPLEAADLIDSTMNCDDIAMNFVISDHCQCAGALFYEPRQPMVNLGVEAGLWRRPDHFITRNKCLDVFARVYKYMPLKVIRNSQCHTRSEILS